ncbi:hypothetical protein AAG570_009598 [Ranatra chinensis]|uniref:Nucleolar protein 14 n=1 Tax=Ranatra chinensis TaxID=642074 RepID=A0ABD0ZAN8_9HEMI
MADKKSRPANKVQSNNPFEVHVNRSKFNVLGRKSKNDRGLPGVSRAKFIKKRKVTLLQEYKVKNKTNRFMDRRIGEHNSAMTQEDRILARFTAERMKAHKRKATMFNLADDEVLTHGGRSLAEIERFDDPRSDDDDEAGGGGALDSQFVEEAHFGGGMLRKSESGAASRMSVIDQLIADSKRRKAERQATKEKTLEMTEQLDTEWRELVPLVSTMTKQRSDPAKEVEKKDSYDLLMNELKFTARGKPTDRLKSENEVAVEEARHLQQLEEERLRRMRGDLDGESTKHGVASQTSRQQHRSADDLDDGCVLIGS